MPICWPARVRANRSVHSAVGVGVDGRSYDDRFLICDIRADLPGWSQERRFYFDPVWNPGRQVLIHPCPDSTFRIDWQVPADFDLEQDLESGRTDQRIRSILGDAPYERVWYSAYRFHSRCVSRMRVGRVLFAGDAAHLVAPFGARGLNSGVMDAENAAWKLAFVWNDWAPESLLDSYDVERRAAAVENIEVTDRTMAFLVPQSSEAMAHRTNVLERSIDDPSAVEAIDSGRFAEPFWYVDSPLTTPDPRRPFDGRPPRGAYPPPAPGIIIPDVPTPGANGAVRLRELVRSGLLAIVGAALSAASVNESLARASPAPHRSCRAIDIDPSGRLTETLGLDDEDVWLIRPDGHIAATLNAPSRDDVIRAARRALGYRSR